MLMILFSIVPMTLVERISIYMSILLVIAIYQLILLDKLPASKLESHLDYFIYAMFISCFSILIIVVISGIFNAEFLSCNYIPKFYQMFYH
jgi:hypothetical protein